MRKYLEIIAEFVFRNWIALCLGLFVFIFAVGSIIEKGNETITPEILQSIGGIGVVVFTGVAIYKGFISK